MTSRATTPAAPVRGAVPLPIDEGNGPIPVAPSTWTVRVPVDLPVRFTYAYLVRGDDSLLVIDPGWDAPATAAIVPEAIKSLGMSVSDIAGIVVTHAHRDHIGSAPDLVQHTGCWVAMHREELHDVASNSTVASWRRHEEGWLDALGVPAAARASALIPEEGVASILRSGVADRILTDGDVLRIGNRALRVLHTPGHSPGSICLVDAASKVIFTGDTLLPRISPNVGWGPEGSTDPLGDYVASLRRLLRYAGWTALPGHEWPFTGIDTRVAFLLEHHTQRGGEIRATLEGYDAADAWTLASELTWSRHWSQLTGFQRRIAAAETAAHLQHFLAEGLVQLVGPYRYAIAIDVAS